MAYLEYVVSAENKNSLCDEISGAVVAFCEKYLPDRRELQRYRLTVEECLLNWLERDAMGKKVTFSCGKRLLRPPFMELTFSGAACNPYRTDKTLGSFGDSILRTLGLSPTYSYREDVNTLRFSVRSDGKTSLKKLFLVLLASAAVGGLGRLLLPENVLGYIQTSVITPVYDTFFRLLSCIAGPMIFLSVAWGVYGIGDASTLSRIGKKMLGSYLKDVFLVALLSIAMVPFFGLHISRGTGRFSSAGGLFDMVLDFFPENIFSPFLNGNTMQIIFLAFAVGIALLFLGKQTESVARAIEQINYLIQFFMSLISKLVPYFVFLVMVSLFWSDSFAILSSSWRMMLVFLGSVALTCIVFFLFTGSRHRVRPLLLMRKCFPSFLVALTTASSAATFSTNVETAEKKLGIDRSVSGFGIPLGMVIHCPVAVLNNMAMALFFAGHYQLEITPLWLVTAAILCAVLAVATPPIPGGGTAAYTMLFLQLGIPMEALAVALALDMVTDFFVTSGEMFCLLPAVVNVSGRIAMLDENILRKDI